VTDSLEQETPRRGFLGQVAVSALALAAAACRGPAAAVESATTVPTPGPRGAAPSNWDDSWTTRLKAKHRAVFDSPEIDDGLALNHTTGYVRAMHDALGSDDAQTVLVLRHHGVPLAFNDAMWAKYAIGEDKKVRDRSGDWATHNPHAGTIAAQLLAKGHIVLACDLATRNYAGQISRRLAGATTAAVYQELKANLIPGVILQPTGVYAAHRAQEVGCTYIRST